MILSLYLMNSLLRDSLQEGDSEPYVENAINLNIIVVTEKDELIHTLISRLY